MSKFKSFIEFREQFGERTVAFNIFLEAVGQMNSKKDPMYKELQKGDFKLGLLINGKEYPFSETMTRIDQEFDRLEAQAKELRDDEIEELFKQKITDKLYDIMNNLDNVDQCVKSCISWEEDK